MLPTLSLQIRARQPTAARCGSRILYYLLLSAEQPLAMTSPSLFVDTYSVNRLMHNLMRDESKHMIVKSIVVELAD